MHRILWTLEFILAALGVAWLGLFTYTGAATIPLLLWDAVAIAYMCSGWLLMRRGLNLYNENDPREYVGPRWYTNVFALIVSCSGLAGGLLMVLNRDDTRGWTVQAIAAATIILSWLLLHTTFAQIYARENSVDGGLEFPKCPSPQFTEYLYTAVTLGTSFAVSDTSVTTTPMRRRVIAHSVISFFFNAVLIAIAIDWVKS